MHQDRWLEYLPIYQLHYIDQKYEKYADPGSSTTPAAAVVYIV